MSRDAAFYGVEVEQPHVYTGAIDTEDGGYLAPPGPVQAANDGRSYSGEFSPDGLYLAYAVYRGGDDSDHYELVVRAVGGDDVRVFKHNLQIGPIGWTPDSRGVLVYSEPGGEKSRVERLDLETGEFTVANPSPDANNAGMQFQVSPDGRHMYAIEPTGGWGVTPGITWSTCRSSGSMSSACTMTPGASSLRPGFLERRVSPPTE